MNTIRKSALAAAIISLTSTMTIAAPHCYTSYGGTKPNKLYLYFPTVADASYPEFGVAAGTPPTSPLHAFNIADLPSYTGTTAALESGIYDVVADDYCEFNVQVISTTTAPPATFPRRNTVGIGTADGTSAGGLFGLAQAVDTNDSTAVDFAHEWAATYQGLYGGPGGALNGANSTVDRWARAIGGTAAHEAGHNYGLGHNDGLILAPGEDPLVHHLMASGSHYSGDDRAGYRRHFSDHEYSILAANVGLSVQTMWNWDFINPNSQTATKVQIDFLSSQASLTIQGAYNGSESPWINPIVSVSLGTQVFKGVTYYHHRAIWSTGHAWDGHTPTGPGPATGVSGQVAGGASFHVGTGFSTVNYNLADPIIITDVTLFDASNNPLSLHPRAMGFDAGDLDAADGSFFFQAFNIEGAPLQLASLQVQFLPRLLDIGFMVSGAKLPLLDVRGQPFAPWSAPVTVKVGRTLEKGVTLPITVAHMSDPRHIVETRTTKDCSVDDRLKGKDVLNCKAGMSVDLFPSTSVFLTANIVDPSAKYWSYAKQTYLQGPLSSRIFLQVAGRHPDLNKNRVDDYLDIASGKSRDSNKDGVPDEAQKLQ